MYWIFNFPYPDQNKVKKPCKEVALKDSGTLGAVPWVPCQSGARAVQEDGQDCKQYKKSINPRRSKKEVEGHPRHGRLKSWQRSRERRHLVISLAS